MCDQILSLFFLIYANRLLSKQSPILKLLFIVTLVYVAVESSEYIERVLFRNRSTTDFSVDNIASGRFTLFIHYIDYMMYDFSFINWIIGSGHLAIQGVMRLMAHNDLLNILSIYGVFGLIMLFAVYKRIYFFVNPIYRKQLLFLFPICVFLQMESYSINRISFLHSIY